MKEPRICKYIFIPLACLFSAKTMYGQKDRFSGSWILKRRISLTGPDYLNGVPQRIRVNMNKDSISIESMDMSSSSGDQNVVKESLEWNGSPTVTWRPGKRKRVSRIVWHADSNSLGRQITYYSAGTDTTIDHVLDETWYLKDGDSTLIMDRLNVGKYSMEGIYEKLDDIEGSGLFISSQSINFRRAPNWSELVGEAGENHKPVFIDCFATWCGPCKRMDFDVFSNKEVAEYMNAKFLSVKVQLDSTQSDDAQTRKWYSIAHDLADKYEISALPTYLFFDPSGELIGKSFGTLNPREFIEMSMNIINGEEEYVLLVHAWKRNDCDGKSMRALANLALARGNELMAKQVARKYILDVLGASGQNNFYDIDNLLFIDSFFNVLTAKDRFVSFYFNHPSVIDSIIGRKGYSRRLCRIWIKNEYVEPQFNRAIKQSGEPLWAAIFDSISRSYGADYANEQLRESKVEWYSKVANWNMYSKWLVRLVDSMSNDDSRKTNFFAMNGWAWSMFQHCTDRGQLKKALDWVDIALKLAPEKRLLPGALDTKANILFKIGRRDEARRLEGLVVELDQEYAKKENRRPNSIMAETLNKMKRNEDTW